MHTWAGIVRAIRGSAFPGARFSLLARAAAPEWAARRRFCALRAVTARACTRGIAFELSTRECGVGVLKTPPGVEYVRVSRDARARGVVQCFAERAGGLFESELRFLRKRVDGNCAGCQWEMRGIGV